MIQRLVNRLRGCAIPEGWITTGEQAMRMASIIDAVLRKFYRARDDEFWTVSTRGSELVDGMHGGLCMAWHMVASVPKCDMMNDECSVR